MPDQSSASTEHALMQEITAPLATLPDDPNQLVADVEFPIVLRGYDRDSVDQYVQQASRMVAELLATRSPEAAVRRALERVGEEVSGILQRAHETAERITTQSRSEAEDRLQTARQEAEQIIRRAEDRLQTARQEAEQIIRRAEDRLRELDAETDRIWAERHRIVEDTRELARELLTMTDSAADRFPPDTPGGEGILPGLDAVPPAGAAPVAPVEGIEAVPPAPGSVEAEDVFPEEEDDGEEAEPTAILPIVEEDADEPDASDKGAS